MVRTDLACLRSDDVSVITPQLCGLTFQIGKRACRIWIEHYFMRSTLCAPRGTNGQRWDAHKCLGSPSAIYAAIAARLRAFGGGEKVLNSISNIDTYKPQPYSHPYDGAMVTATPPTYPGRWSTLPLTKSPGGHPARVTFFATAFLLPVSYWIYVMRAANPSWGKLAKERAERRRAWVLGARSA
jgi:hypothetical protein